MDWKKSLLPIILVGITFLFSCGGGGGVDPIQIGPGEGDPGVQGNILPPPNPADIPQTGTITGALGSAPLGTDPAFNVVEASDTIETNLVNGTSSVRSTSQEEDRLFWVAVVGRGGEPIEGQAVPPLSEGDDIDLYMRYQVYDGELTIARLWFMEAAGLDYIEPAVEHAQAGVYEAIFPFTIPFGSAGLEASFVGALGTARGVSVGAMGDAVDDVRAVIVIIEETPTLPPINYPETPDAVNDLQGGGGGCLPAYINVTFDGTSVWVESEKELSNVVLEFDDGTHFKFDDLDVNPRYEDTFVGIGDDAGKDIVGVWVKSGCNDSGDGPGYGEYFAVSYDDGETYVELAMAQFAWEDLLTNGDYDYNDFVGRLRATEFRDLDNNLVQVTMVVKAVARAAGYDSNWQFNVGAAFPGNRVISYVDQYLVSGARHGDQRIYVSDGGMSVPIFTPIRDALPNPPGSTITNGIPGTDFIDGDYAVITVLLQNPMAQGTYTPIPYEPELLVAAPGGAYTISMWREPGDWVDSNGRPLAFIVPDTYAWPLEGVPIWNVYSGYHGWVDWIEDATAVPTTPIPTPVWWDQELVDPHGAFDISKFNVVP